MRKSIAVLLFSLCAFIGNAQNNDWANFARYQKEDEAVSSAPVAILIGDSITELWYMTDPAFFKENNYLGRGISGQASSQILVRLTSDALNLKPKVVVILAGTNDIALNNGCVPLEHVFDNIVAMAQLTRAHGIVPIICSVTPSAKFGWRTNVDPVPQIRSLNSRLEEYSSKNGYLFLNYYPALATESGAFNPSFSKDGTHPTMEGYKVMEPMLNEMIAKALKMYPKYQRKAVVR